MTSPLLDTRASSRKRGFALVHALPTVTIWLAPLLLYTATVARGVLAADSGEFQLVAARWGIAHPPGYPLYTVVGALWVHLFPFGSLPFRLNLLSALIAATTLWLLSRAVTQWARQIGASKGQSRAAGALAVLALALATTFWAQATTANIRMPTMLFTAWGYLALAKYRAAQGKPAAQQRALIELALALGLGVGHHPSLIFVALGWALYLLLVTPRLILQPRRWGAAALAGALAWLIPQLYLPIRSGMQNVVFDPGNLTTWHGFWNHVLARGFGGDMFAYAGLNDLALRLPLLPTLFRMQYPSLVLAAMMLGWFWLLRRTPNLALSLLVSWGTMTFVTITYRAPQTVEYLMPAYIPMAMTFGLALTTTRPQSSARSNRRSRLTQLGVTAISVSALLVGLPGKTQDFAALARSTAIRDRVEPLLTHAPDDALILADWRWATPLWVLQTMTPAGESVEVRYVIPDETTSYEDAWRQHAEQAGDRALYTTHAYAWDAWVFAPVGGGYRLYPRPLNKVPESLAYADMEADLGPIQLLGYQIAGEAVPGRAVELRLAWTATEAPETPPSFTTRLWDTNGGLLTAADRALGHETAPGEVQIARFTLQLPLDRCASVIAPSVGVYTVVDGEFQDLGAVYLPEIQARCRYPYLPTGHPRPGAVWGGPFLRGIDYDAQGNGTALAYLHWCGPGNGLLLRTENDAQAQVDDLGLGACQTIILPTRVGERLQLTLARLDGAPVRFTGTPWPKAEPDDRYLPFGDQILLIGNDLDQPARPPDTTRLTLTWRTLRPLEDDYAISVRLQDEGGAWLGMHDMQPGFGALPTLKWVTRNNIIFDPHSFSTPERQPFTFSVVVYERFRITSLKSPLGETTTYRLDHELP